VNRPMPSKPQKPSQDLMPCPPKRGLSYRAHGSTKLTSKEITSFLVSMSGTYPMWNIKPTDENVALWHSELGSYTVLDLRRAYQQIVNQPGRSPPSLPEIKRLCKTGSYASRERPTQAIDGGAPDHPPVSEERAKENVARLRRIVASMELKPEDHCNTRHLPPKLKDRFNESVNGHPTYRGYIVNPQFIMNLDNRAAYEQEITDWKEAQNA
jgi:hypothetical protein